MGEDAKTALVVEDNGEIAYLLCYLLEREGFVVTHLSDGRQAVRAIETQPAVSLVLLDIMLPFFDGHELLRRIRAAPVWSAVPVIMLTAKSQEGDVVKALDAGANDYIVKPFKPDELLARIRRTVKKTP